jgi:ferritin-like metal-binding protein YciE/hemerythrin superfamily protein
MLKLIADRGTGEPVSFGAALIAGKKVGVDVTALLAEDHRVVQGWFAWYEVAEPAVKARLAKRICNALRAHMAGEEEVLYPAAEHQIGEKGLVQRAIAEHKAAQTIMSRIETGAADQQRDADMAELKTMIVTHIVEEEGELFPALRRTSLDLYAVGRALAARRVDQLFKIVNPQPPEHSLQEFEKMPVSQEEARNYFIVGLRNAHASGRQGQTMVQAQIARLENYPNVKARLEAQLQEKERQLARIEQILTDLGESPSTFKDVAMSTMAGVLSAAAGTADDEIIKNSFTTYAHCKFEEAAYETLLVFGEAAGAYQALPLLQQSLSEERGFAAFLAENMRGTAVRFLQLRTEGRQAKR